MNILFYIPDLNKNIGGIFQYSIGVLKSFSKLTNHTFYVYHPNRDAFIVEIISESKNIILLESKEAKINSVIRYGQTGYNLFADLKNKKQRIYFSTIVDKIIKKNKIDLVHSPFQFLPEYKADTPGISTMHDVQELKFPEFFSPKERALRAITYNRTIARSSKVIVSYDHIKKDIVKFFNKSAEDIEVCKISMQNLWFEKTKEIEKPDRELADQFLLYPAATWQHKNHINLFKSIAILKKKGRIINLICTGHQSEYYEELNTFLIENSLADQIKFFGPVSEEMLLHLYKKCSAVVIPTLYEAGSFPLMESIILNIPVICANTTSLPETIGENKFVFDPNSSDDIANKIESILFDDEFIKENKTNNLRQSQILQVVNFSETIDNLYNNIYQS